jgi:hypothetical protein
VAESTRVKRGEQQERRPLREEWRFSRRVDPGRVQQIPWGRELVFYLGFIGLVLLGVNHGATPANCDRHYYRTERWNTSREFSRDP